MKEAVGELNDPVVALQARLLYLQISIGGMDEDSLFHPFRANILEFQRGAALAVVKKEIG